MADDNTATDDTSAGQQQSTDGEQSSDQNTQQQTQDTATQSQDTATQSQNTATQSQDTSEGAPEQYTAFTLPDDVTLDDTLMGEFSQVAKDANLPQDKAQSLVELGVKMAKGFESATQQSLDELKNQFATNLKNDKELGGEKLDENLGIAQRAIDTYGSDELKSMLKESGLGNHPELVRFFRAVGQTISEDSDVDGGASQGGEKSLAERMYGSNAA